MARWLIVFACGLLCGCRSTPAPSRSEVTVAAAANLTDVFAKIGPAFESQTNIHPVFSFASTAQLAQQIENGAPFDVFTAADASHVADLDRKGLLVPGSRVVYARGVLALWIPPSSRADISTLDGLKSPAVRTVAIAKPELAPYGQAALETLRRLGIWDAIQPKVVYAENISMARQYGQSKNADAVFTAYSLVLHESGRLIPVDEDLHQPIDQSLGIVAKSQHQAAARKFVDYLFKGDGRAMLESFGYRVGTKAQ